MSGPRLVARTPMADVESKMGIQPIEELLAERDVFVKKVCELRARYGSFGTFDHLRKVEISRIKGLIRAQATRDKRRMNNDQVDEEAHAHPDYITFITQATIDRAEWVRLENMIEGIDFTIQRGQAVARYVSAEAHF